MDCFIHFVDKEIKNLYSGQEISKYIEFFILCIRCDKWSTFFNSDLAHGRRLRPSQPLYVKLTPGSNDFFLISLKKTNEKQKIGS